jgi:hypothetical protein
MHVIGFHIVILHTYMHTYIHTCMHKYVYTYIHRYREDDWDDTHTYIHRKIDRVRISGRAAATERLQQSGCSTNAGSCGADEELRAGALLQLCWSCRSVAALLQLLAGRKPPPLTYLKAPALTYQKGGT